MRWSVISFISASFPGGRSSGAGRFHGGDRRSYDEKPDTGAAGSRIWICARVRRSLSAARPYPRTARAQLWSTTPLPWSAHWHCPGAKARACLLAPVRLQFRLHHTVTSLTHTHTVSVKPHMKQFDFDRVRLKEMNSPLLKQLGQRLPACRVPLEAAVSCRFTVSELSSTITARQSTAAKGRSIRSSAFGRCCLQESCAFHGPQKINGLYGFVRFIIICIQVIVHKYYVQLTPFRGVKVHPGRNKWQLTSERDA